MADTPEVRMRFTAGGADAVASAVRQLSQELQQLKQRQQEANESALTLGKAFDGLLTSAAVYKIIEFGKEAFNSTVQIGRLSQQTGVTVKSLSALAVAGSAVGVSQDKIGTSVVRLEKNLDALSQGNKKATDSFAKIGLSAKDFAGLNTDQKVLKVMDAIGQMDAGTAKTAATVAIFGRGAAALIPVMNQVATEGFEKLQDHAQDLGRLLDDDTVASFMAGAAAMDEIKQSAMGVATQFEAGLIPALADSADEVVRGTSGGKSGFQTLGEMAGDVIRFLVVGFEELGSDVALVVNEAISDFEHLWAVIQEGGSAVWKAFADAAHGNFEAAWRDLKSGWSTATMLTKDALAEENRLEAENLKAKRDLENRMFNPAEQRKRQQARVAAFKGGMGEEGEDEGTANTAGADAAAKARLALLKAGLENELKLYKDQAKLTAAQDKDNYDQGIIDLQTHFARRRQAIEDDAQKEIETLQAERGLAAQEPAKDEAAAIAKRQKIADIDAKIAEARVNADVQEATNDRELFDQEQRQQKELVGFQDELLQAQGKTFDAEINHIAQVATAMRRALAQMGLSPALADQYQVQATANTVFTESQKAGSQAAEQFQIDRQAIQIKATAGLMTQYDANQLILALERERIGALEQLAEGELAAARNTGDDAKILAAEQFKNKIDEIRASTEAAAAQWLVFENNTFRALQSNLTNYLTSGIDQAKSLGDAFRGLGATALQAIRQIATEMLMEMAMSKLKDWFDTLRGGGKGSGTGTIANVAQAAAGVAQAAPLHAASATLAMAGATIISGATELGISAGELMAAAAELQIANSMSGAGGFGFAGGGLVSGPGSSTSDSISARLSDGEFVVRAAAVRAIGVHTLAAINRGLRIPPIVAGSIPRFAEGGLVQATPGQRDEEIRLLIGLERGLVVEHLRSKDARRVIVNQVHQNAKAVTRALARG